MPSKHLPANNLCSVVCVSPTPTVTWYKDGVRIQNIGNTGRTNFDGYTLSYNDVELKIVRPRKEDEGVFRCAVENTRGKRETTSNLLVHCKSYLYLFTTRYVL